MRASVNWKKFGYINLHDMSFSPLNPSDVWDSVVSITKGSATTNLVFVLGGLIQIILVMVLIKSSFRDNNVTRLSWVTSLCYSIVFVVAAPFMSQIISATVVWIAPYLFKFLDVLGLISTFSPIDEVVAALTRPWAYFLALSTTIVFLTWRIHSARRRPFRWFYISHVVLIAFFSNILLQLLLYSIVKTLKQ